MSINITNIILQMSQIYSILNVYYKYIIYLLISIDIFRVLQYNWLNNLKHKWLTAKLIGQVILFKIMN